MTLASVIIPTRNRADLLADCLDSLCRQSLAAGAFEVIVVDNGSTDHTRQVTERYAGILSIRCIEASEPGLHVGRHAGRRAATSGILLFADDDIRAGPTWVESVVKAFEDQQVGLVGGNNYPEFEAEPPAWLRKWWETPGPRGKSVGYLSILDFGDVDGPGDPSYVWGCNFAVRATALDQVGGFHPDGLPREKVLLRGDGESYVARAVAGAGWATRFVAGASVRHRVPASRMTAGYFERRGYDQGVSDSYTQIRSSRRVGSAVRLQASSWLRHQVRTLRHRAAYGSTQTDAALVNVLRAASRAWRKGYLDHARACRCDPALMEWVLKDGYLDE